LTSRFAAYACFALVGALAVLSFLLEVLPLAFSTYQVLGMLIGIPAVLLGVVASLVGTWLALFRWREWPLLVMAAALVAVLAIFLLGESLPREAYTRHRSRLNVASGGMMAVVVLLSARWYLLDFGRRRRGS
jgi:hypothetical protein